MSIVRGSWLRHNCYAPVCMGDAGAKPTLILPRPVLRPGEAAIGLASKRIFLRYPGWLRRGLTTCACEPQRAFPATGCDFKYFSVNAACV